MKISKIINDFGKQIAGSDYWHHLAFGSKATCEDLDKAENFIGKALPDGYKELHLRFGPYSVCDVEEDEYKNGYYRMLSVEEAIDITKSERKVWQEECPDSEKNNSILKNSYFFQYGFHEDKLYALYFTPKASNGYIILNYGVDGFDLSTAIHSFEDFLSGITGFIASK